MNHKATQQRLLAENLRRDVLAPICKFRTDLQEQMSAISIQSAESIGVVEGLHKAYRGAHHRYVSSFRYACRQYSACLEKGLSAPTLSPVSLL